MKTPALASLFLVLFGAVQTLGAQEFVLEFNSSAYIDRGSQTGDVELSRTPKPARAATHTLYPFGPAAPRIDYSGPEFHLGYEVKASAPSDLTIEADKAVVEDNFYNPHPNVADTISLTAQAAWPVTNTYSVAAVVVFPVKPFMLTGLSYSALNWTQNKSYTEKLRHRWVVQTGGRYYVSVNFVGRTGRQANDQPVDIISALRNSSQLSLWVEYNPEGSIFAALDGPRVALGSALDNVTAVGFYMDALDFNGAGMGQRQWQLRLINFSAVGHPKP